MKRNLCLVLVAVLAAYGVAFAQTAAKPATQEQPERWLHVRVESTGDKAELVRVNVPLSLAEKVLPAIKAHEMHEGKIRMRHARIEDVDVRAILEAVKTAKDGEFVTVQSTRENVRVAKSQGFLVVQVEETREGKAKKTVDVKVPMAVVEAMLSAGPEELDIVAGVRALGAFGDTVLVEVKDDRQTVRVWVDSKNVSQ